MYTAGAQHSSSRLSIWRPAPQEKLLLCVNVAGPGWASPERRSRPAHGWKGRPRSWQRSARWYQAFFFFFKQKTAYEMLRSLVGSEMCIRDRLCVNVAGPGWASPEKRSHPAHGWKGRPRSWQRSARWYQLFYFYRWYQALAGTLH